MTDHPRAIAARMAESPKLAASVTGLTVDEVRAIRDLRRERRAKRTGRPVQKQQVRRDPLLSMSDAALDRLNTRMDDELRAEREEAARATAVRDTLIAAARIARSLGFAVRSSTMRGRVSSYYAERDGVTLRISDHDIPETPERAHVAGGHYDGYRGRWLRIDRPRSETWLRRAIMLAAAGRSVPGADR